jgi:hypothetical protein
MGMGSLLRLANKELTDTYYFGEAPAEGETDDRDFMVVRAELSKGEVNRVLSNAPQGERDLQGGLRFLEHFFEEIMVRWSLQDETGDPLPPTVENYRNLEAVAAKWVDERLSEHLNKVVGREVENLESKSV